jgi:hypothetical protein
MVGIELNPFIRDLDVECVQYYKEIDIWCTNEEYPPLLEIDTRLLLPEKRFKFIDLAMLLPEGMWLHRKYDNVMYNSIISIGENYNYFLASTQFPFDSFKKSQDKERKDIIEQLKESKLKAAETKIKKPVNMPIMAASSKKLLAAKNEGADQKAITNMMKKASKSPKKDKKGQPSKPAAVKPAE